MFQLVPKWDWRLRSNELAGALAIIFDIRSLISFRFIKIENDSEHLY